MNNIKNLVNGISQEYENFKENLTEIGGIGVYHSLLKIDEMISELKEIVNEKP